MEAGDGASRQGGRVGAGGVKGGRPSEEAIRNRLIDRRRSFETAEADRKVRNRLRQRLRRSAALPFLPRGGGPEGAVRIGGRIGRAMRDRPILAFCATVSLSAAILVPLALSSFEPLTGERPLPPTILGETGGPTLQKSAPSDDPQLAATTGAEAKPSIFEALEKEEASLGGRTGWKPAAPAASPGSQPTAAGANILGSTTLRQAASAGPLFAGGSKPANAAAEVATGPDAAPAISNGAPAIDPVAAALALRLPPEPAEGGGSAATPDPLTTGGIAPTAGDAATADTMQAASANAAATVDAAGTAGNFVAVSPSILIASGRPVAATGAATEIGANPASDPAADAAGAEPAAEAGGGSDEAPPRSDDAAPANREAALSPAAKGSATASVNMRAEPTNDGRIVAILAKGDPVTVVSCKGWCEVETAAGQKGYVYEKFIARETKG
ncbi:SH3 domain-containing protein [Jiella sonneratiae]|uniref:SH3 domain-containing protein n=1 Tax=Jiella sonneratiae TaxID=2816856 RepID=A0ABS3J3G4_9HYPH|nr:SH3 domain-containing protein [Jiella sonneratiae]MBO0904199.1 SH3 domain-containing protein [Jiella sonneratiae]